MDGRCCVHGCTLCFKVSSQGRVHVGVEPLSWAYTVRSSPGFVLLLHMNVLWSPACPTQPHFPCHRKASCSNRLAANISLGSFLASTAYRCMQASASRCLHPAPRGRHSPQNPSSSQPCQVSCSRLHAAAISRVVVADRGHSHGACLQILSAFTVCNRAACSTQSQLLHADIWKYQCVRIAPASSATLVSLLGCLGCAVAILWSGV